MLLSSGYVTPRTPGIPDQSVSGFPDLGAEDTTGNPDPRRLAKVVSPEKAAMIDRSFGSSQTATNGVQLRIIQLNADGNETEQWLIYNPIITKISWGELDYGDDGLVEYTLDVAYDWAELIEPATPTPFKQESE